MPFWSMFFISEEFRSHDLSKIKKDILLSYCSKYTNLSNTGLLFSLMYLGPCILVLSAKSSMWPKTIDRKPTIFVWNQIIHWNERLNQK